MADTLLTDAESPLRADAARNRQRILLAAEEVLMERGADASLEEIAKRAKVGIGTLYRRFPTRDALLAALSDERLMALADASRAGAERLSPGEAIRAFMAELVAHTTHCRGLAASLGTVLKSGTPGCHAGRVEAERLLARAQATGAARNDVSVDDLVCIVTAIALAVEADPSTASRLAQRVDLFLDGIAPR